MKPGDQNVSSAAPSRSRRLFLHALHLSSLAMLLTSFMVYAVTTDLSPVSDVVKGTAVERFCKRVSAMIGGRGQPPGRQQELAFLTPAETEVARLIGARMRAIQPTHLVQLQDGRAFYGAIAAHRDEALMLEVFDGSSMTSLPIRWDQIVHRQRIVMPDEQLNAADWRFLSQFSELNPYFIAPYVIVSSGDFGQAYLVYRILNQLEEDFRLALAPVQGNARRRTRAHVCIIPEAKDFYAVAGEQHSHRVLNAAAFYSSAQNCLFIHQPESLDLQRYTQLLRHEGTHELLAGSGLSRPEPLPLWLEEGMAEHFSAAYGSENERRLGWEFCQLAEQENLVPWETLIASDRAFHTATTARAAYLQGWVLTRYFMSDRLRPRFLAYLAQSKRQLNSLTELSNALNQTSTNTIQEAVRAAGAARR